MRTGIVSIALAGLLTAGCVSPRATQPNAGSTALKNVQRVKLVVTDSVNSSYSRQGLPLFEGLLQGKLQSEGYTVVTNDPQLTLAVTVNEFSAGNRTLRTVVGFGAGRAVLKFKADFKAPDGQVLAGFTGGKAYHGTELVDNPTFKTDESTRMGLISYSVSQIGEFIEKNGKL